MDAYRRNVQLKRRCSGLESRERQLNRKITHPGVEPVRLSPIKRMQIYRETCPVIKVIIVSRSLASGGCVLFSLSCWTPRRETSSFRSKGPARFDFLFLNYCRYNLQSSLSLFRGSFHDNFFFPRSGLAENVCAAVR